MKVPPVLPFANMQSLPAKLLLAGASLLFIFAVLETAFRLLDIRGYHEPRTREWEHALLPEAERFERASLPLAGRHNATNALFALAAARPVARDKDGGGQDDGEGDQEVLWCGAHGPKTVQGAIPLPSG